MAVVQCSLSACGRMLESWSPCYCWYCQVTGGSVWGDNCSCWDGQCLKTAITSPNIPIFPAGPGATSFQNSWRTQLLSTSCPISAPACSPSIIHWQQQHSLQPLWNIHVRSLLFNSSLAYLTLQKYWKDMWDYITVHVSFWYINHKKNCADCVGICFAVLDTLLTKAQQPCEKLCLRLGCLIDFSVRSCSGVAADI